MVKSTTDWTERQSHVAQKIRGTFDSEMCYTEIYPIFFTRELHSNTSTSDKNVHSENQSAINTMLVHRNLAGDHTDHCVFRDRPRIVCAKNREGKTSGSSFWWGYSRYCGCQIETRHDSAVFRISKNVRSGGSNPESIRGSIASESVPRGAARTVGKIHKREDRSLDHLFRKH